MINAEQLRVFEERVVYSFEIQTDTLPHQGDTCHC